MENRNSTGGLRFDPDKDPEIHITTSVPRGLLGAEMALELLFFFLASSLMHGTAIFVKTESVN
jgi:hypothetical protein